MPWCPKCKYEYKEGITTCADCGGELVDDLSFIAENEKQSAEVEKEFIEGLLKASSEFEFEYDEDEEEIIEDIRNKVKTAETPGVYVNSEEKAEENRTSAYTLITIGILGILFIILFFFDLIPIHLPAFNKYLITGVMGAMFVLFFVMGLVSLRNFKIFKEKAKTENNLTTSIKAWSVSNLNPEEIDLKFDFEGVSEEIKYFQRTQYVKDAINRQFMNLDEAYLNRLVDEVYSDIFEA